jgi:uncharacterized coiled-coil protein SlyX
MIDKLEQRYHIRVISVMEPLHMHPDSPYYHHFRSQILQNAELELRIIRDRTLFGIHNAQKQGRYTAKAPIGYLNRKDQEGNPIIVVDPARAPLILEAFNRFIKGESISTIRSILRTKGINISGNSSVQRLLQNPVYMGHVNKIAYYDTPASIVKAIHDPIVSEDTWWKAQAIFNNKKKLMKNSVSEDFPLRGVLKCFCDRLYTAAYSRGRNAQYGYYKCNTHTAINLSAKKVHLQFEELMKEMSLPKLHIQYLEQKIIENINEQLKERSSSSENIRRQISSLSKKIDSVEEKYINNDLDKSTYAKWKSTYHSERSALQQSLSSLQQPVEEIWQNYQDSLGMLGSLHWCYQAASVEDKQGIIREVFNNQLYYQDSIYRTTYLLSIFHHKALTLKEKRLLIYEKPLEEIGKFDGSAPHGNSIEPLQRLLAIFSKLKAA